MTTFPYTEDELAIQAKDRETFRSARTAAQRRIERKAAEAARILAVLLDGVSGDEKAEILEHLADHAAEARHEACKTLYAGIAFAADVSRLAAADEAYRMADVVCELLAKELSAPTDKQKLPLRTGIIGKPQPGQGLFKERK